VKRPSFQFYPGDWLEEIGLRASCLAARGLWADMLCFMHQGEPYGHLRKDGRDINTAQLARMVGETVKKTARLLGELEANHVFSRTAAGTIFSRRQVRDEELREVRAKGGPKGGAAAFRNPRASRPGEAREGGRRIDNDGGSEGGSKTTPLPTPLTPPPSSPSPSPSATAAAAAPDNGHSERGLSKSFLSPDEHARNIAECDRLLDVLMADNPDQDRAWLLRQHSLVKGSGAYIVRPDTAKHEHLIRTVQSLRDAVAKVKAAESGEHGGLLTAAEHERRRQG
jgi:hypothetical protein